MAIRTLWMDSDGDGALEYSARDFRDLVASLYDPGVLTPSALRVVQRSAGANMTVTVTGPGRAVIDSSYTTDMGRYLATVTADEEDIAISAAPGSGTRRDIVGLQAQDDAAGGPTDVRETVVVVVTGDTSGDDPALPPSFLPLARVRVPAGTASITDGLIDDLRVLAGRRVQPGEYMDVAHSWTVSGWLDCDGSAVSRTAYADLFALLGTTYGTGDGSTTFNVPDHRGRLPVAAAAGATGTNRVVTGAVGTVGGSKDSIVVAHTHTGPSHQHAIDHDHAPVGADTNPTGAIVGWPGTINIPGIVASQQGAGVVAQPFVDPPNFTGLSGAAGTGATSSTGTSGTNANVPPVVAVRRLIRT